ncbi:biotin/lipoyl-binding protein, partial [bacterium]|nr:biotin/lipoyl-binding protein [bacterium]
NTSIASPAAGTVKAVLVAAGDSVREGQQLVDFN